jgi:purine-binding chemotaxis protein CheW
MLSAGVAQYLTFLVGGMEYAIDILTVREIIGYEAAKRVPQTPSFLKGVVSLRGAALPVVDLAVKLSLPEIEAEKRACVLIVDGVYAGESIAMGFVVESVGRVLDVASDAVQPPPPFGPGARVDYLVGVARSEAGFVLIVELERILSSEELFDAVSPEALARALEAAADAS